MSEQPTQTPVPGDKHPIPWVNLWMIAFGVLALLFMGFPYIGGRISVGSVGGFTLSILPYAVVLLIVIVGIARMPSRRWSREEPHSPSMEELTVLYLRSWRRLWRWKWLLAIFAAVAIVAILASIPTAYFTALRERSHAEEPGMRMWRTYWLQLDWHGLRSGLRFGFESQLRSALAEFDPGLHLTYYRYGLALTALVVLILTPWLWRRLKELGAGEAGFARTMLILSAIVAIPALIVPPLLFNRAMTHRHIPEFPSPWWWAMVLGVMLPALFYAVVLSGGLTAGLAGSIKRAADGAQVTARSFVSEAVRYMRPMLGVLLILALFGLPVLILSLAPSRPGGVSQSVGLLLSGLWWWVSPLLIFIPYAVVIRGGGAVTSIRRGIGDWLRNAVGALSFIALGLSLVTVPLILLNTLAYMLRVNVWVKTAFDGLDNLLGALVSAFLAIAVWEFYRSITLGSSLDTLPESG